MRVDTDPTDPDYFLWNCSFCGHHRDNISGLIVGPKVSICYECIGLSVKIIEKEKSKT